MKKKNICLWTVLFFIFVLPFSVDAFDGQHLVEASFHYLRGKASVSQVKMTIHRPGWERIITIKAWTRGEKESLFTILSPAKDFGNGTLKKGREMWIYNPKINRIIKLPPSMMSQSWMGSDFSNNDLSKSDSLLNEYIHTITGTTVENGKKVYLVKSIPKPDAPVVWGMQKLKIREDNIILEETFYDEDLKPVKNLKFLNIRMIAGKLYPGKWMMKKTGENDKYTVVEYIKLTFKDSLPSNMFNLTSLKYSRR